MSAILDSVLDDERRVEIAANDAALAAGDGTQRAFVVRIGRRGAPRLEFTAMSPSSAQCFMQHFDLAEPGERCEIVAAGAVS